MTSRTAGTSTTDFTYQGTSENLSTSTGSEVTRYSYSPGGPLAQQTGTGTVKVLLRDLHGDVVGTASPGSSQTGSQDFYSAFGERTGSSSSLGFQGQYTDSDTSLVDMLTRDYVPGLGRFSTRDSLFGELTSPMSLNQFGYASGNPISYSDPAGMAAAPMAPCGGTATLPGGSVLRGGACGGSFLSFVHTTLDLAGFIPVFGAIPDLANAGIYAAEGRWGDAAISVGAAVPFAGDAAKGVHIVRKLCSEGCDEVIEAIAKGGDDALSGADEIAGLSDEAADFLSKGPADTHVYIFRNEQGKLIYVGISKDTASRWAKHKGRPGFFKPGLVTETLVTRGQARAIEQGAISTADLQNLANKINSIAGSHPYFADVKTWGTSWLKANTPDVFDELELLNIPKQAL